MKTHWNKKSGVLLLLFITLFQFLLPVSTATEGENHSNRKKRSKDHVGDDLETEESRAPFGVAISPPRYEGHPSERSWRFIQGPRFTHPSPNFSPQPSYHLGQSEQYPRLDFRLNPHASIREPQPYTQPSQRPRPIHSNPYVREYPSKGDDSYNNKKDQSHPRSQVHDFQTYREPPTELRAPQEHSPPRHYNVGHQLPEQDSPNYQRHPGSQEEIRHDIQNQKDNVRSTHNQSQGHEETYDDYDDYWNNEEQIPPPSGNNGNEGLQSRDQTSSNEPPQEQIGSIKQEQPHDLNEKIKSESSPNLSKNLATLLAGTTGSRNLETPKEILEQTSPKFKDNPSKTRTTVPEHLKPAKTDSSDQYYDELYEEFVDMYYDEEITTLIPNEDHLEIEQEGKEIESENSGSKDETLTATKTPKLFTTSKAATSSSESTTTSTITTRLTSGTRATTPVIVRKTSDTGPPISLSEIIQELGLSLPQFLGTLKTHGTSLKDFTEKLQTKSLSKTEFRRAKGNVKKLLEILESGPDRPSKKTEDTVQSEQDSQLTTKTNSTEQETNNLSSNSSVTSTTEKSKDVPKSSRPLVFGSGHSGNLFTKTLSITEKSTESISKNSSDSDATTKPPLSIELDMSHIANEKGISSADILQDFNKMFNISDTKTSTISPELNKSTTISLRPYISGAERNRPYRPTDFERGNRNIHRGVINSRLSSTTRPTLRPPYSPKPPSINYGESDDFISVEFVPKTEEEKQHSSSQDSKYNDINTKKKNKYEEFHFNTGKTNPENMDVSTRSAIMAAGILGGVALSVFIAIFIVVKYKNHVHRNRRRFPLTLPSDSSTSSLPPIYASRNAFCKEAYETSGFWTTLKKRFDPYSTSSSPTSM